MADAGNPEVLLPPGHERRQRGQRGARADGHDLGRSDRFREWGIDTRPATAVNG